MTDRSLTAHGRAPMHLWIVGILALLWGAMGAFDYLATQLEWEFYIGQFTAEQAEYFYSFPAWMVAAWAFAVWCGLAGAVGLLLRKSWAVWMYTISVAGLLVSSLYNFVLSDGAEIMGSAAVVFTVVIWVLAIALLLYTMKLARAGVLR